MSFIGLPHPIPQKNVHLSATATTSSPQQTQNYHTNVLQILIIFLQLSSNSSRKENHQNPIQNHLQCATTTTQILNGLYYTITVKKITYVLNCTWLKRLFAFKVLSFMLVFVPIMAYHFDKIFLSEKNMDGFGNVKLLKNLSKWLFFG